MSDDPNANTVSKEDYDMLFEELEAMERSSKDLEKELKSTLTLREGDLKALRKKLNDEQIAKEQYREKVTNLMATEQELRDTVQRLQNGGDEDEVSDANSGAGRAASPAGASPQATTSGAGSPQTKTQLVAELRDEVEKLERIQRENDFKLRKAEQSLSDSEEKRLLLEQELEEEREVSLEARKQRDVLRKDVSELQDGLQKAETKNKELEKKAAAAHRDPALDTQPAPKATAAPAVPPGCVVVEGKELKKLVGKLKALAEKVAELQQQQGCVDESGKGTAAAGSDAAADAMKGVPSAGNYFDEF